jgi:hypothetical protein
MTHEHTVPSPGKRPRVQERVLALTTYLSACGLIWQELAPLAVHRRRFLVAWSRDAGTDLATLSISPLNGILLTARPGPLRDVLCTWIEQQGVQRFSDWSSPLELLRVEALRAMLVNADQSGTSCPTLALTAEDHPLVALAHRLGYRVEVTMSAPTIRREPPRYHLIREGETVAAGETLLDAMASLPDWSPLAKEKARQEHTPSEKKGEPLSLQNEAKPPEMASGACSGDSKSGEPGRRTPCTISKSS